MIRGIVGIAVSVMAGLTGVELFNHGEVALGLAAGVLGIVAGGMLMDSE